MSNSKLHMSVSISESVYPRDKVRCDDCERHYHIDDLEMLGGKELCHKCYDKLRSNNVRWARDKKMKENNVKGAIHSVCKNPEHTIIHLDRLDVTPHELESLDEFYCSSCNKFWREP